MMSKWCLALAIFLVAISLPLRAFDWETATANGHEYVTLRSFCQFYAFNYAAPSGNDRFTARNGAHSVSFKIGSSDAYIDGVHYVLSFPIEGGDHDWLVSRMDVIKLFEPIMRPSEISGRHTIRGVVIDAGHGGSDNGAGSRLGNEKTYTLDTAGRLAKILNDAGLKTVFTRRTDTFVDLYERAHIASLYSDYCFVSVHFNSASPEARGLETYCLSPRGAASTSSRYLMRGDIQKLPGNEYDAQNILLASMVHSEIIKLNPGDSSADRGVKRARFVVIKANVLPAILVEGGFVSNRMEAARVNQPSYRQSLAQAIARGVIKFVNAEGDRHLALPQSGSLDTASAPKDKPPLAPTGLARDPANGKKTTGTSTSTGNASAPSSSGNSSQDQTTSIHKSKRDKTKKTATSPAPQPKTGTPTPSPLPPPPSAPAATTNAVTASSAAGHNTLGLTEPAAPTPSAGADKAPPEPDEPPTVNIYPTTPAHGSNSTNAPPEHEP